MTVVNPEDTEHTILIIPRYYPDSGVTLSLYNEATQETETVTNDYEIIDGNMFVNFEFTFSDNANYQLKISEGEEVVYRGKIFATTQDPQDFKLTSNVYYS